MRRIKKKSNLFYSFHLITKQLIAIFGLNKDRRMKYFLTLSFLSLFISVQAYNASDVNHPETLLFKDTTPPKVFILGEHEKAYEKLNLEYSVMLLTACNGDMESAYQKWISMLNEMEAYATLINYDIKGVKVWLNVFWNVDGSIKHIAYHLKQNSRNIDTAEFTAFLISFINHYKFPLVTQSKYSHYGSASFPTHPRKLNTDTGSGKLTPNDANQTYSRDGARTKD